jgi:hypothetical protein
MYPVTSPPEMMMRHDRVLQDPAAADEMHASNRPEYFGRHQLVRQHPETWPVGWSLRLPSLGSNQRPNMHIGLHLISCIIRSSQVM